MSQDSLAGRRIRVLHFYKSHSHLYDLLDGVEIAFVRSKAPREKAGEWLALLPAALLFELLALKPRELAARKSDGEESQDESRRN